MKMIMTTNDDKARRSQILGIDVEYNARSGVHLQMDEALNIAKLFPKPTTSGDGSRLAGMLQSAPMHFAFWLSLHCMPY